MPRKPRFYLPGIPAHIVQRGNDRQAVFFADSDYQVYLSGDEKGVSTLYGMKKGSVPFIQGHG